MHFIMACKVLTKGLSEGEKVEKMLIFQRGLRNEGLGHTLAAPAQKKDYVAEKIDQC